MKILLDTNLLILPPRQELLAGHETDTFYTSALSYAELREGEFSSSPETRLRSALQYEYARQVYGEGLPFDDQASRMYRIVCQTIVEHGRELSRTRRVDIMIAAIACANSCALATRNIADFQGLDGLLSVIKL